MSEMSQPKDTGHQPSWWPKAQAQGLVPAGAAPVDDEPSAWLIAVLMVGAAFCALPAMGFFVMLLNDALLGPAGWLLALLLLAGSVAVLRMQCVLFVQCLAVVGLAVAMIWLGMLLIEDKHGSNGRYSVLFGAEAVLALACAWLVRPRWVQQALGVVLASSVVALVAQWGDGQLWWTAAIGGAAALIAAVWAMWVWREARMLGQAEAQRWSAVADGVAVGALGAAVSVGQFAGLHHWAREDMLRPAWMLLVASGWPCVLVALAGAALVHRWRAQASAEGADLRWLPWLWLCVALLTACSLIMPGLAAVGVLAAMAAATARWRLLMACGLAALYILSRFYYDLSWPLTHKAAVLAATGAVLGLALWMGARQRDAGSVQDLAPAAAPHTARWATALIATAAVACLALVNLDVQRKEAVVARGEAIYVPLVPVDPRSLMQGDYMDLRFDIPTPVVGALADLNDRSVRRQADVVVQLDAQHQASVVRLAQAGEALGVNERRMPVKRLKGQWVLVTDAYFFPEGEGKRFEAARFGEFRVLADGRALLIGLVDGQRRPISSPHDLRN